MVESIQKEAVAQDDGMSPLGTRSSRILLHFLCSLECCSGVKHSLSSSMWNNCLILQSLLKQLHL